MSSPWPDVDNWSILVSLSHVTYGDAYHQGQMFLLSSRGFVVGPLSIDFYESLLNSGDFLTSAISKVNRMGLCSFESLCCQELSGSQKY